jgi:hypothetical protein
MVLEIEYPRIFIKDLLEFVQIIIFISLSIHAVDMEY